MLERIYKCWYDSDINPDPYFTKNNDHKSAIHFSMCHIDDLEYLQIEDCGMRNIIFIEKPRGHILDEN